MAVKYVESGHWEDDVMYNSHNNYYKKKRYRCHLVLGREGF